MDNILRNVFTKFGASTHRDVTSPEIGLNSWSEKIVTQNSASARKHDWCNRRNKWNESM